ncbi:MAG: hypothetical protein RBQ88_03755 [Desulfobulbus oligotrophicus]|jgi:hypothetical protein|nr:hypothetical protein [Desulfobulbus oligotrophicus]
MASSAQLKTTSIVLLASFFVVLFAIFSPLFPGAGGQKVNGLDYLDNFFNQLAKSSAYYIPGQLEQAKKYDGQQFSATLKMKNEAAAAIVAQLLTTNTIDATTEGDQVQVSGDFGAMMATILSDADLMYKNDGTALKTKYGVTERQVVYSWHQALDAMEKDFTGSGQFEQAKFVKNCMAKSVEPAYNFYEVEAKPVKEEMVLLIAALAFYVIYTMWYGYGLLFLFEGLGIRLDH